MNLGLSILTAALLLLAFPPYGQAWVAAFALAPLLYACARESSWKARLVNGWIAFTIYWLFHCIWIEFVLDVHGGMGFWGGWGAFLLFALAKGLHTGLFALFAGWLSNRWWSLPAIAALWTGIERTQKYDGFTWLQLGNAGINMPLPMRLAPITGVYGLSFVFAMLGCAVAVMALRRSRKELAWLLVLAILLVLPRLPRPAEPSEKALVVQPNVDTETRWTRNTLVDTEIDLQRLSRGAGASLILWPETPAPFYPKDSEFRDYIAQIAKDAQAPFLLGVVEYTDKQEPLNSALLLNPAGQRVERYDKINLVPFGEFIPPLFGWVSRISGEIGDFIPGNRIVVFPLDGHKASAFICYESAFPELVRQFAHNGANVLFNLSNDGYFGTSAAREQHLLLVRMRAAENRRWIIRATNDGLTAVVDPRGRIVGRFDPYVRMAGMLPYGYVSEETLYTKYGDWFVWSCLVVGLALSVAQAMRERTIQSRT